MKSYHHLTAWKRYTIFLLIQANFRKNFICFLLKISRSALYRELKRNSENLRYDPDEADSKSRSRRKNCHRKPVISGKLKAEIIRMLQLNWSPEQIAGRLKLEQKADISHQSIYNFIEADRCAGGEIYKLLRRKKKYRKRRTKETRGQIKKRIPITDRPAEVNSRKRFGDWELDTMVSRKDKTALITAVERKSRYTVAMKVGSRNSGSIARSLKKYLNGLPCPVLTLTSDNGKEFADHRQISKFFRCGFFFSLPHHPWERGSNENTNGLLREYFPKGESFRNFTKTEIKKITDKLNSRPRKCLNFMTPAEIFFNIALENNENNAILSNVQQKCCT